MPYPCDDCCNPVPEPCSFCNAGETPPALKLVVTGFLGNDCSNEADFNAIDVIIQQEDPAFCEFNETIGSPLGGIGDGVASCDSRATTLRVEVTLQNDEIEVRIINEADAAPTTDYNEYIFRKTGLGSKFSCCDEMTPALTIPFVSQTAFGSGVTLGHDGGTATVTLECMKCDYCTDGAPAEMSVTIGTGSTGGGDGVDDCTNAECEGIAGTYVLPQSSQCSWRKYVSPEGMHVQIMDGFGTTMCGDPPPFGTGGGAADGALISVVISENTITVTVDVWYESAPALPQFKHNIHTWKDTTLSNPHDCNSFSSRSIPWLSDWGTRLGGGIGDPCDTSAVAVTVTSL